MPRVAASVTSAPSPYALGKPFSSIPAPCSAITTGAGLARATMPRAATTRTGSMMRSPVLVAPIGMRHQLSPSRSRYALRCAESAVNSARSWRTTVLGSLNRTAVSSSPGVAVRSESRSVKSARVHASESGVGASAASAASSCARTWSSGCATTVNSSVSEVSRALCGVTRRAT